MFTVKHITVTGEEELQEAEEVRLFHPNNALTSDTRNVAYSRKFGEDGIVIASGSVYVMNGNGKTVAVYHLGDPNATTIYPSGERKSQTGTSKFVLPDGASLVG